MRPVNTLQHVKLVELIFNRNILTDGLCWLVSFRHISIKSRRFHNQLKVPSVHLNIQWEWKLDSWDSLLSFLWGGCLYHNGRNLVHLFAEHQHSLESIISTAADCQVRRSLTCVGFTAKQKDQCWGETRLWLVWDLTTRSDRTETVGVELHSTFWKYHSTFR